MTYHQAFDRLGNPVARSTRTDWQHRVIRWCRAGHHCGVHGHSSVGALTMGQVHTCNELGECHSRTPACQGCTHQEETQSAKALTTSTHGTRNAGCCVLDDEVFRKPITPIGRIAYWYCVVGATYMTIVIVLGSLGYLSTKACSP